MAKRKRAYFCAPGYANKRDAEHDAAAYRKTGKRATVKRAPGGFKVCISFPKMSSASRKRLKRLF